MKNFVFLLLVIIGVSCNKESPVLSYEEQLEVDTKIIDDYLAENGLVAESTVEGLKYSIDKEGNGIFPASGSTVVVNYIGKFLNGNVFDANITGGFSFPLGKGAVISGWDIGVSLLSMGSKATLYIPSGLAYGTSGAGNIIGPNEVLIFDVELPLSYEEQLAIDTKIIDDYLALNGLTAESTDEGFRFIITEVGEGDFPVKGSIAVVNYTGKLLDGTVFDSSDNGEFSFPLGDGVVIEGWDIGIALLNKGAKATLYLPSGLAYGTRSPEGEIGVYRNLIFDVELVDIK
jgi:peptidylprolyl isomerase